MKITTLIISILISLLSYGQKIALLDHNYKLPILFTDSVTVEQIRSGYFPVLTSNIDTFYANVNYIIQMLEVRQRAKMKSFELRTGNNIITVSRVPFSNGDRYLAIAKNKIGEINAVLNLTDYNISNKRNKEKLEKLLSYIKNNKSLFSEPYEIHPKIYNAIIITE